MGSEVRLPGFKSSPHHITGDKHEMLNKVPDITVNTSLTTRLLLTAWQSFKSNPIFIIVSEPISGLSIVLDKMYKTKRSSHTCPNVCSNKKKRKREIFASFNGIHPQLHTLKLTPHLWFQRGKDISTIFSSGKSPQNHDSKKQKNLIWCVALRKDQS